MLPLLFRLPNFGLVVSRGVSSSLAVALESGDGKGDSDVECRGRCRDGSQIEGTAAALVVDVMADVGRRYGNTKTLRTSAPAAVSRGIGGRVCVCMCVQACVGVCVCVYVRGTRV